MILSQMTGYIGVMTALGSKFNKSDEHLRSFLGEIKKRGLLFFQGVVSSDSLAPKLAKEIGLPNVTTNVVIDVIPTKSQIDAKIDELEKMLSKKNAVVAIAEGYPTSIERIATWTSNLESKKFVLAPLSAIIHKQSLK